MSASVKAILNSAVAKPKLLLGICIASLKCAWIIGDFSSDKIATAHAPPRMTVLTTAEYRVAIGPAVLVHFSLILPYAQFFLDGQAYAVFTHAAFKGLRLLDLSNRWFVTLGAVTIFIMAVRGSNATASVRRCGSAASR